MCAPKRSQERPGIDSKSSRNGARIPSGTALGPRRGQECPQSAKTPRKSRESRAKVGPRIPEGPPRDPKKEPKIEVHGKMAVAGATRERQKSRRALCFRLFRFGALPGTILIDFGCPGEGAFWYHFEYQNVFLLKQQKGVEKSTFFAWVFQGFLSCFRKPFLVHF